MSLRFRRSLKLAPGIRMNFSGSGVSWSFGPRGASVNVGQRGTYLNAGIPGTGLYTRTRLEHETNQRSTSSDGMVNVALTVSVSDDGTVCFIDEQGNPASEYLISNAKKKKGDEIRAFIQGKCDEINAQIASLGEIHIHTPDSKIKPSCITKEFSENPPWLPPYKEVHFLAGLFKFWRVKIEHENDLLRKQNEHVMQVWQEKKDKFLQEQSQRKQLIEQDIYTDTTAMDKFLEENLHEIVWPRETTISLDILDSGKRVFLDVDLPEIENIPNKTATFPARGYKLSIKEMSATQVQKLYMRHVHGIGFRIIGETFAVLPVAEEVVLSAYSKRPDPATGKIRDDYLYSVRVKRQDWEHIEFSRLDSIDVIEALGQFELRRHMTVTGIFKPVVPFSPDDK